MKAFEVNFYVSTVLKMDGVGRVKKQNKKIFLLSTDVVFLRNIIIATLKYIFVSRTLL